MSIEQNNLLREAHYSDDEISLYDLYRVLVKRKNLIAIVVASVFAVCIIYLVSVQRIYQISAVLLPPTGSGNLYLTNLEIKDEADFKPEQAFKLYTQELTSNDRWSEYTKQEKKLFPRITKDEQFRNPFKVDKDKDIPYEHVVFKYETPHKDTAVEIAQGYLRFAERGLVDTLSQQIKQDIEHNIKALELEIQLDRDAAKQERLDKIVQLQNDLAIAKQLGIVDNAYFNLAGKGAGNMTGVFNIFTNNTTTPTYLRGT